ncbi:MAG: hypothetical protein LBT64_02145 [Puniceicoccales bacterium]|jgi:uncharacterized alkaline shock family protein YloU|nr:hypothetical protein [Puniceicoccales bacterium]
MIDAFKNIHWQCDLSKCLFDGYSLAAIAAIAIATIFLIFIFRSRKIFIAKSCSGTISLTKNALRRMIVSVARDIGLSEKVYTKIRCRRNCICIDVTIRANGWQNVANVSKELHDRLRETLVDVIGIAAIKKINIIIAGFSFRGAMSNGAHAEEQRGHRDDVDREE